MAKGISTVVTVYGIHTAMATGCITRVARAIIAHEFIISTVAKARILRAVNAIK